MSILNEKLNQLHKDLEPLRKDLEFFLVLITEILLSKLKFQLFRFLKEEISS